MFLHLTYLRAAYTISRAILSDAIALTRGDRFFTSDYTPYNMTSWGFQDCQRDSAAPGYGSTLGRLFLRTLPKHFSPNSVYTWFPLLTPETMKPVLQQLGDAHLYDFNEPGIVPEVPDVGNYKAVVEILRNPEKFGAPHHVHTNSLVRGSGYVVCSWNFNPSS